MEKQFIIDTAVCVCKFGTTPGRLKVNSHNLVVMNHGNRKIATSRDLQNTFYPPGFGSCSYGGKRPCSPMVTQWSNVYKGMRLPGNAYPLMPDSKATCSVSNTPCIDITFHGQIEIPGPLQIQNATAEHQSDLDPAGRLSQEEEIDITVQQIQ